MSSLGCGVGMSRRVAARSVVMTFATLRPGTAPPISSFWLNVLQVGTLDLTCLVRITSNKPYV